MNFLSFIIALSLHQVLQVGSVLQRDDWLHYFDDVAARFLPGAALRLLALLLALGFLAGWFLDWLDGWFFGVPMLLGAALMLVWSMGREDYHTALECYEARFETDSAAACEAVSALWIPPTLPEADSSVGRSADEKVPEPVDGTVDEAAEDKDPPSDNCSESDTQDALRRLAYSGYERWFAPVFFFITFGPIGAFLYRVVAVLAQRADGGAAQALLYWVHWIPARLLALTFALTGDFLALVQNHPASWFVERRPVPDLLLETATCACKGADGARAISSIMYRSAGLWLLVTALGYLLL